ncbi:hypothetical protein BO78DRAFT_413748 [Aspergillus sclerotiicarbonarius CBS 121057]|uniref:Uncharacterized protein n=1 Tax=Aspergillus sclerotiicarbonarius (strain CBS 121057 / IBT 28362) TaxID=1448318 RepID=A0A319EPK3_ASPSB|nr:hypothetical protein BO78DRAFT_413748 [Aspergillus sclerotiicarbonarius CBS 121057]
MASLKRVSQIESEVTQLLDNAGIHNCIWGEGILLMLGVSLTLEKFTWVIPDDEIDKANKALRYWTYERLMKSEHPGKPYGECLGDYIYRCSSNDRREVHLIRQSRLCWTFPRPPIWSPKPDDKFYMLTREMQRLSEGLTLRDYSLRESYPVRMPKPARFLEALVLLRVRDLFVPKPFDPWGKQLKMIARHLFEVFVCDGLLAPFGDYLVRYKTQIKDEDRESFSYADLFKMYACLTKMRQLPLPDEQVTKGNFSEEQDAKERFRKMRVTPGPIPYRGPMPGTWVMSHYDVAKALENELWG